MKISEAMRERMEQQGWSAEDVAALAGLARSTVFRLLDDCGDTRRSTLRKLKKLRVKHPLVDAA